MLLQEIFRTAEKLKPVESSSRNSIFGAKIAKLPADLSVVLKIRIPFLGPPN